MARRSADMARLLRAEREINERIRETQRELARLRACMVALLCIAEYGSTAGEDQPVN